MKRPLGRLNKKQRRLILIIVVSLLLVGGGIGYFLFKDSQNKAQDTAEESLRARGATSTDASADPVIAAYEAPIAETADDTEKAALYAMKIQQLKANSDYESAIETALLLIDLQPNIPANYGQLASLYRMVGEKQKAIEALKKAIRLAEGSENGKYAADAPYYKDVLSSTEGDS